MRHKVDDMTAQFLESCCLCNVSCIQVCACSQVV